MKTKLRIKILFIVIGLVLGYVIGLLHIAYANNERMYTKDVQINHLTETLARFKVENDKWTEWGKQQCANADKMFEDFNTKHPGEFTYTPCNWTQK